jgi:hypothetical protein
MVAALADEEVRRHYRQRLTYANDASQAQRLKAVILRAGEVVAPLSVGAGRLARKIVDTRNMLVHMPAGDEPPLRGLDLVEASRLLVLALEANLLLDLELAPDRVQRLIAGAYESQLVWRRLLDRGNAWATGR